MAKKDPTDLTVEEKLKALYQLQVTLSGIDENRELRGELPLEVQDLEDDIAGLTTRIENIQREIEQFDRAVYQKQNEIADAQASLERYHAQLDTVSNNREYDTLSKEIEFQELEIELCNKKIREGMAKMREREFDLHKAEEKKAEVKAEATPASSGEAVYHTVVAGETMGHIALKYEGATQKSIEALNPDIDPTKMQIGQKIRVK